MPLCIASKCSQKVLQLRSMLKEHLPSCEVLSLYDFPRSQVQTDTALPTITERAKFIATNSAQILGIPCLTEQWMLCIPGIDLAPIFAKSSSRSEQTKLILNELQGHKELERSAYFESCICWASSNGKIYQTHARLEGVIAESERGKASIDFENIFIKHDYQKTLAELSESVRVRISARRKAVEKLALYIEGIS